MAPISVAFLGGLERKLTNLKTGYDQKRINEGRLDKPGEQIRRSFFYSVDVLSLDPNLPNLETDLLSIVLDDISTFLAIWSPLWRGLRLETRNSRQRATLDYTVVHSILSCSITCEAKYKISHGLRI